MADVGQSGAKIKIKGTALSKKALAQLSRLRVVESMDQLDLVEITFIVPVKEPKLILAFAEPGAEFSITLLAGDKKSVEFKGDIHEVQHRRGNAVGWELTLVGFDKLERLRKSRDAKVWEKGVKSALETIAGDAGLGKDIQGVQSTKDILVQTDKDDITFAKEKAEQYNYFVRAWDGKMVFGRRLQGKGDFKADWTKDVLNCDITTSIKEVVTEVYVHHHDYKADTAIKADYKTAAKFSGGTDGVSLAKKAFGARKLILTWAGTKETSAAKELAQAVFEGKAETFLRGECTLANRPDAKSGMKFKMEKGAWPYTGPFLITECEHILEAGGLMTTIVRFISDSLPAKQ